MSVLPATLVLISDSDGRRYLAGRPATFSIVWDAQGKKLAGDIRRRQVDRHTDDTLILNP